jgi:hypothetical protein
VPRTHLSNINKKALLLETIIWLWVLSLFSLIFLVWKKRTLMRLLCCLSVYPYMSISYFFLLGSLWYHFAVCVSRTLVFSFSMLSVSYLGGLWNHPSVSISVYIPYKRPKAWTSVYKTWYVYHVTWANHNGVLHKFFPSLCVSICVTILLLGNGSVKTLPRQRYIRNNRRIVGGEFFYAVRVIVSCPACNQTWWLEQSLFDVWGWCCGCCFIPVK